MMEYAQALEYIHAHKRFASAPTLDRMKKLMALLENPQDRLKFVHVAGTNGKGSTASMTASVLREAGYRVGMTVSPFILDFRERMQVDGRMIPVETLAALTEEIRPMADRVDELTEFELVTALAFVWFAREKCDIVVAEVGLGGRYDATNVIKAPLVPVVTRIGLDHTAILGGTVERIAAEKAQIIKPGCKMAMTVANQPGGVMDVLAARCAEVGCVLTHPTPGTERILHMGLDGTDLEYQGHRLHIPLPGKHQVENALSAFTVLGCLIGEGYDVAESLTPGIAKTRFPARMEVLSREPLVIVDGAHNPDGARALAAALSLAGERPLVGVIGMAADKDSESALALLAPRFRRLICTNPDTPRALAAVGLAEKARAYCDDVTVCADSRAACALGLREVQERGGALVVCGSLYLAAPARKYFVDLFGVA